MSIFVASGQSGFHDCLMNTPRVTVQRTNGWTAVAILLFAVNCVGAFLFLNSGNTESSGSRVFPDKWFVVALAGVAASGAAHY